MRQYLGFFKVGDLILIFLLCIFSSLGIFGPRYYFNNLANTNDRMVIVIQVDGQQYKRIPLGAEESSYILLVEGVIGTSKVQVEASRVRMKEAPAPDHYRIAVNTGWISRPGPMIINMPNRVAIWIEGVNEDGLDGITW